MTSTNKAVKNNDIIIHLAALIGIFIPTILLWHI